MKYYILKFPLVLVVAILFIEISCSRSFDSSIPTNQEGAFRVWALADIQPVNTQHKVAFKNAIEDINLATKNIDIAIVAGDIVDRANETTFDWYLFERNNSYIKEWYEIIGNHDLKTDMGKLFRSKLKKDPHYTLMRGNILFIFLSDEKRGKSTVIYGDTFEWWKKLVVDNQDKIIVVITHAPLEGSSIPFSTRDGRKVEDSHRFVEILKKYRVDLWLSGHLHLPHAFTNAIVKKDDLNGTVFTHISSIRPELLGIKHSESRLIEFICDTKKLRIKSRDHKTKKWDNTLEASYELPQKVLCN